MHLCLRKAAMNLASSLKSRIIPLDIRTFLETCAEAFDEAEGYLTDDRIVVRTFRSNPGNRSLDHVIPKVAILNALYRTQIFNVYGMAEHIISQPLDGLLGQDRVAAVSRIRGGHGLRTKSGGEWDFYSFATKYCHFHRPDVYPIYDAYVCVGLRWLDRYLASGRRLTFDSMRDYELFSGLVERVRADVWPGRTDFKRVDQALWVLGTLIESDADKEITLRTGPLPDRSPE